jgi:N-acetylmuramoyl-L-alanine amidase
MKLPLLRATAITALALALSSCDSVSPQVQAWNQRYQTVGGLTQVTPAMLYREVGVNVNLLPKGRVGRVGWAMQPRYITIHSTQNFDSSADAFQHSRALQKGALRAHKRPGGNRTGFLTWHFTVQSNAAVQHLPTKEQGEHADFDGQGNRTSIGIEMCENRGSDLGATVERTAKLAAYLMYVHRLPLSSVVPHYHWPRAGVSPAHKDCPHFLLNKGKPGATWRWFQSRVQAHYQRIVPGPIVGV